MCCAMMMSYVPTAWPTAASTPCPVIFIVIPLSTPLGKSKFTFFVCRFMSREPDKTHDTMMCDVDNVKKVCKWGE